MPSPDTSLATLRPDLGGSLMEFDLAMDREGFIASRILPVFESQKPMGPFGRIPIKQLLQNRDTERAPGSGYNRGKFTFTKDTFSCDEHGIEETVDAKEAAMYDEFFDLEQVCAERALDVVLRNAEKRAAAMIFNATTWTGAPLTTAVTTEWSVAASAKPRADVKAAMIKMWEGSGLWPNALVINQIVFENLKDAAEIVDRLKYAGFTDPRPGQINEAAIAQALGIQQVIVAGSAKNTANQAQTVSIASVWDNEYAMVCRVATRPRDIKEPCIGRTIHYAGDGSTIGGTVEAYRDETVRADIIRVRHDVDEKLMYKQAGHLLSNITA